jgi:sporulation protein YlmC with PRC-barrel domain
MMTNPSTRSAATAHGHAHGHDRELRLDRLLGRPVLGVDGRRIGRLEEVRAEKRGNGYVVTGYVIGAAGLLERLGLGARLLFGSGRTGYVAAWDEVDLRDPDHPRLTCPVEELRAV